MDNSTQKKSKKPVKVQATAPIDEMQSTVQNAMICLERKIDLEASERYSGALLRRRVIQSSWDLLRLVMVYSLTDYSLQMVGLWGTVMEWGSLCKSGVRKRLCHCQKWIGMLIVMVLSSGKLTLPRHPGMHLRLFDACTVSRPGSHRADWRLHLSFDLTAGRMDDVQLTPAAQGETLTRYQFRPDEICLADRAYGVLRSLGKLLGGLAYCVIRIGWQNLPVQDRQGQPFAISDWLGVQSTDPARGPIQTVVWVMTPQGRFQMRLIAQAIPPEKAEKTRQHLRAEAKCKKRQLDVRSLLAAGFIMVVSNLPESSWSAAQILALYRFRWQIELVFKRLKGILSFDHLRANDPQLAQVYLLTKILIALLLGDAQWRMALATPEVFQNPLRPVSEWRLTQVLYEAFREALCGSLTLDLIWKHRHHLGRYLCDGPCHRQWHLAAALDLGKLSGF